MGSMHKMKIAADLYVKGWLWMTWHQLHELEADGKCWQWYHVATWCKDCLLAIVLDSTFEILSDCYRQRGYTIKAEVWNFH